MNPVIPLLVVWCAAGALYGGQQPNEDKQKALPPSWDSPMTFANEWQRYDGIDFTLFYYTPEEPRSGAAAVWLSKIPFIPEPYSGTTLTKGAVGRFETEWIKRERADGTLQQEAAAIKVGPGKFAHVIVEASTQADLDALQSDLSHLPIFASAEPAARARPGVSLESTIITPAETYRRVGPSAVSFAQIFSGAPWTLSSSRSPALNFPTFPIPLASQDPPQALAASPPGKGDGPAAIRSRTSSSQRKKRVARSGRTKRKSSASAKLLVRSMLRRLSLAKARAMEARERNSTRRRTDSRRAER